MTYPPDGARAGGLPAQPDDLAPWRRRLDGIVVGAVDRAVGWLYPLVDRVRRFGWRAEAV